MQRRQDAVAGCAQSRGCPHGPYKGFPRAARGGEGWGDVVDGNGCVCGWWHAHSCSRVVVAGMGGVRVMSFSLCTSRQGRRAQKHRVATSPALLNRSANNYPGVTPVGTGG